MLSMVFLFGSGFSVTFCGNARLFPSNCLSWKFIGIVRLQSKLHQCKGIITTFPKIPKVKCFDTFPNCYGQLNYLSENYAHPVYNYIL